MPFCPHLSLALTAASVVQRLNEGFCRVCVCNILTCSCFELQQPYGQRIVFPCCYMFECSCDRMYIRDEKLFETWTQFLVPGGDLSFQLVIKSDSVCVFMCLWANPGKHTQHFSSPILQITLCNHSFFSQTDLLIRSAGVFNLFQAKDPLVDKRHPVTFEVGIAVTCI